MDSIDSYASLDMAVDKLPAIDTAEASHVCSLRYYLSWLSVYVCESIYLCLCPTHSLYLSLSLSLSHLSLTLSLFLIPLCFNKNYTQRRQILLTINSGCL